MQLFLLAESTYVVTMIFLKISLGLFFLRISVLKVQRWTIYTIVFVSTLFGIAYFLYSLLQCGAPIQAQKYWEMRFLDECVSNSSILGMSYVHAILMAATDLTLAALPIPMIYRSRITNHEKWIVTGIFAIAVA
jgi:hypothetical protein